MDILYCDGDMMYVMTLGMGHINTLSVSSCYLTPSCVYGENKQMGVFVAQPVN